MAKNKEEKDFEFVVENQTKKSKKKSKKKRKKKEASYKNKYLSDTLVKEWDVLKCDMEKMQKSINKADRKRGKNGEIVFETTICNKQIKVRKNIIKLLRDSMFLDSVLYVITHSKSMIKVIAKMFCVLIISIFSFDGIRKLIPDALFNKIDNVYQVAANM